MDSARISFLDLLQKPSVSYLTEASMETFFKLRYDLGLCMFFTLPFSLLTLFITTNANHVLLGMLHAGITFFGGLVLCAKSSNTECATAGLTIKNARRPMEFPRIPLWFKFVIAAGIWLGLRYLMLPETTRTILGILTSGWR